MESDENLDDKLRENPLYKFITETDALKNSNRYMVPMFFQKFEEFVDDFVRLSYELSGKDHMTMEGISKAMYKIIDIRVKPKRISDWIFKYQEETGFDIIREIPDSNPKLYALSEMQKSLMKGGP